jgi:L-ascorbate metabolism protein UlaG (beta-lactamase superfamily)
MVYLKFRNLIKWCLMFYFITMNAALFSRNLPEVDKIPTSAGEVEIYFIGHGSLMLKLNNFVIHIDPVKSSGQYDGLPKADLILVTHEHYDHLDTELLADLRKQETILLCNPASAAKVPWGRIMKSGDKMTVEGISIETVPAYNIINERSQGQPFHPKGVGNGYVITLGEKRFYVAGDTENTPEMKALKGIDVAFLPMNLPYTMTPDMVADAAKSFKPGILYPYHFGDTNTDEIIRLLKGTNIEVRIRKLN